VITEYKLRDYNQFKLGADHYKNRGLCDLSEFQFFQVEWKFHRIHAMIFHQPFFSKRSETFDTIDVNLTISELFPGVNASVYESV
jgi:hypothetical protein